METLRNTKEREKKKAFYQKKVDSVIRSLKDKKFSSSKLAIELGVSRERARQIIREYDLVVPSYDYLNSEQFADLKELVESGDVANFTSEELYRERYKKFLPKDLIRGFVSSSGKYFSNTKKGIYAKFFANTITEDKDVDELFLAIQEMFPKKKFSYWAFSVAVYERRIPYKKKRTIKFPNSRATNAKNEVDKLSEEILKFLEEGEIESIHYNISQLMGMFNEERKDKVEVPLFRRVLLVNGIDTSRTKSLAFVNRVLSLNIDFKEHTFDEIVELHNNKFPNLKATKKDLYNHYCYPILKA